MQTWQLQQAKAKLSELIRKFVKGGPKKSSLSLSKADFDRFTKKKPALVDFMRKSPLVGVRLDFKRDKSLGRKVNL